MNIHNVEFIKSAASARDFITDGLPAVVFSGRSNVGKSSVINRLLARKSLARVSASPGKTAHVNYFLVDGQLYLIDLPGYGYARVAQSERDRWGRLMESFFASGDLFTLGVLIVDARHKPTSDDITMCDWFKQSESPFVVLANKCDKLKKSEFEPNLSRIKETLELSPETKVIPFSAEKGTGREELLSEITARCL